MKSDVFFEIRDLRFSYGGAKILNGISVRVSESEVVCVIGANGAGKTTMLRVISGLETPSSGRIIFKGQRIDGLSPKEIIARGISQVPERGRVFPDMNVYENLLMGAFIRKDKLGISRDLSRVYTYFPQMLERRAQRAGSLSGGERQILAVARALMNNPRMLIMDEPSAGLAPKQQAMLGQIILDLDREGISIILVEQNAEMALHVADYAYVMERGSIGLEGKAKDLIHNDMVEKTYLGL